MQETLTVRLGPDLAEALQEEARRTGLTKGEIARRAIADRLKTSGALSVMSRHFGTITGPSDLSTNKGYRRAWSQKRR